GCFFFQAEDGIRDWSVTGVQTCALPIFVLRDIGNDDVLIGCEADFADMVLRDAAQSREDRGGRKILYAAVLDEQGEVRTAVFARSEERRVGKGGRGRGARKDVKRKSERQ